jgi:hypothetical protein
VGVVGGLWVVDRVWRRDPPHQGYKAGGWDAVDGVQLVSGSVSDWFRSSGNRMRCRWFRFQLGRGLLNPTFARIRRITTPPRCSHKLDGNEYGSPSDSSDTACREGKACIGFRLGRAFVFPPNQATPPRSKHQFHGNKSGLLPVGQRSRVGRDAHSTGSIPLEG